MKKKILILVFNNLKGDARVRRQIEALKRDYELTVVCLASEPTSEFELIILPQSKLTLSKKILVSSLLLLRLHRLAYKALYNYGSFLKQQLLNRHFDLTIVNDVEPLPLSFEVNDAKVLLDAHEYAPRHFEDKLAWRILFQRFNTWLCRTYIHRVAGMTTIGTGLAKEYEKHFHVSPVVITNAAYYHELNPAPVEEGRIRLVHHGIINISRRLDLMIDMMELLDERFTLDLFLLIPETASKKTKAYIARFTERLKGNKKITWHPAVKSSDVVRTVNKYDVGVFLLPPVNFNYENTLPNKLFDFIQARLAIAIGPTPEMAEVVKRYENGIVADDFTPASLAKKLSKLTKGEIEKFKLQSGAAAKVLNAEHNTIILKDCIEKIISQRK